jgi:DNA-binding NtrC family response regulator
MAINDTVITTIMVVEPDVIVRMALSDFLRECGFRVIEGVKADDVWSVLDSQIAIDIVLAEVHLSCESEGFSLAKRLRQTRPNVDVILTSGIVDAAEKSSDLGGRGPKKMPYQPQRLMERIHQLLERRRSAEKAREG